MSRKTFGEKGKGAVKPGNWGYGYTIEYDKSQPKGLSCKVCRYIRDDKSCKMTNAYIPEIGYNMWKHCKYFDLAKEFREEELLEKLCRFYSNPLNLKRYFKYAKKIKEKEENIEKMKLQKEYPALIECEKNRKRNIREIKQNFSIFPDINEELRSEIEDVLKNIIILALENEIDLDDIFSPIAMIYKENKYCEKWLSDRSKKNINLEYGHSLNIPYYSVLFFINLKKVFKFNIDCIFNMTEEERNRKLINIINNKLKFRCPKYIINIDDIDDIDDLDVLYKVNGEFKEKLNHSRYYDLLIQRHFDEESNCFTFTLNLKSDPLNFCGAFCRLIEDIDLYSEKEDGILMEKYLDAISIWLKDALIFY